MRNETAQKFDRMIYLLEKILKELQDQCKQGDIFMRSDITSGSYTKCEVHGPEGTIQGSAFGV